MLPYLLSDAKEMRYLRFSIVVLILLLIFVIEPNNLQVTYNSFDLLDGGSIKVVFISDIHNSFSDKGYFDRIVDLVNEQDADIILIGGDFIDGIGEDWKKIDRLAELESRHGTYAVLGNHDYGYLWCSDHVQCAGILEQRLEQLNITVLRNEHEVLEINKQKFLLAGLDDPWSGMSNYSAAVEGSPELPKIILAHNQMSVIKENLEGKNLILSGHTHCGDIYIPFFTDFILKQTRFSDHTRGRVRINEESELYVTCGLVHSVRLFTNPEISVLNIE